MPWNKPDIVDAPRRKSRKLFKLLPRNPLNLADCNVAKTLFTIDNGTAKNIKPNKYDQFLLKTKTELPLLRFTFIISKEEGLCELLTMPRSTPFTFVLRKERLPPNISRRASLPTTTPEGALRASKFLTPSNASATP